MTYEEALIDLQSIYKGHGGLYTDDSPAWKLAFDALEKQIPKKPIRYVTAFPSCCIVSKCPNCEQEFGFNSDFNFCENCGQRLDFRSESIDNEDE